MDKTVVLAILCFLLLGCISSSDSYKAQHVLSPAPEILAYCNLENLSQFATGNGKQYACVASTAIAKNDPSLCDYAPDFEACGGGGAHWGGLAGGGCSVSNTESCKKGFNGSFFWGNFLQRDHAQVMKTLQIAKDSGFDFNKRKYMVQGSDSTPAPIIIAAAELPLVDIWQPIPYDELRASEFEGRKEIISYLISNGADIDAKDDEGRTALHWLAATIPGSFIDNPNYELETFQFLIDHGADVNAKDDEGRTPLMAALSEPVAPHRETVVSLLLQNKAEVNMADNSGKTALMYASLGGYDCGYSLESVKLLIAAGADVNKKDLGGNTAFLLSQNDPCKNISQVLLESGANISVSSPTGIRTALMALVSLKDSEGDWEERADFLLKNGENINAQDAKGRTALIRAISQFDREKVWYEVPVETRFEVVKYLLENGADSNISDQDGKTPLMYAAALQTSNDYAKGYSAKLTDLLIANGADVNAKDTKGRTALMYLAAGCMDVMSAGSIIVNHGANVNVQDNLGRTPLHYMGAACSGEPVTYLLKNGADSDIADNAGKKPITNNDYDEDTSFWKEIRSMKTMLISD